MINQGIYHNSLTNRGIIAYFLGLLLVVIYILLYFFDSTLSWFIQLFDPISNLTNGKAASKWYVYGLLYTLAVLIMGFRMLNKYAHNNYLKLKTISVMFFQTSFAFIIPEIMSHLNLPYQDLKNIWPLDYYFFFDWNLNGKIAAGTIGYFMIGWGIFLIIVGVPVMTYFFGKRWYCSWVCGCGGLAETAGDSFRHLSNKSHTAWKIERYSVYFVLFFAIFMTLCVLYTYVSGQSKILVFLDTGSLRSIYGFWIGGIFAGVIGTGFYPIMGNRVWCRFGCPLAAYLGIIQKWKSKFRITVNHNQCISCGQCSTHCEMGIDVRAYAQKNEDIVRASCVGCGICAEVCPRGVLNLENLPIIKK